MSEFKSEVGADGLKDSIMQNPPTPRLFIGPWVGEFGVELLRWQGIGRTLAASRKWQEVTVATHPDRFFLYEDFATRFIPVYPPSIHTVGYRCLDYRPEDSNHRYFDIEDGDILLSPQTEGPAERVYYPLSACRSTYRNFADGVPFPEFSYQILVHARATAKANQKYKNWAVDRYESFVEALPRTYRIASIGAKDAAHKIRGTDDLRGIPLRELASYCRGAKVMLGPSSGPIHFAMHCGTSVVTWIHTHERFNYFPQWNPLRVPFCCLSDWQPEPDVVLHKFNELMLHTASRAQPIEYLILGIGGDWQTEFIQWLAELNPETRYIQWKNCVRQGMAGPSPGDFFLPYEECTPRNLHRNSSDSAFVTWNRNGRHSARILSFDSQMISQVATHSEAKEAKKVLLLLRDAPNTIAHLKSSAQEFKSRHLLHETFQDQISVYRAYLKEAVGESKWLSDLRHKVHFISYNKWCADERYRNQIAGKLGKPRFETHSHKAGAQGQIGIRGASDRDNQLWKRFELHQDFWNLVCDDELFRMEQAIHGDCYPDFAKM